MSQKVVVAVVAVLSALIVAWSYLPGFPGGSSTASNAGSTAQTLVLPEFTTLAQAGQEAFQQNCSACHGATATGTDRGPSLIDTIYRPGVHSDMAIVLAPRNGVRSHHWRFGNMPRIDGVTEEQIRGIIQFIRELQKANGIT